MDKIFVDFFHVLAQFPYTRSESELDYYHRKVTVWVTEQLKPEDLKKYETSANLWIAWHWRQVPSWPLKSQI